MTVLLSRKSGQKAFAHLPNRRVIKGGPSPPESYEEVRGPMLATLGPNAIACTDSAWAWGKVLKMDFGGQVPHAVANHGKREYVRAVKVTKKPAAGPGRPTKVGVKGGDNRAEASFKSVKGQLRRRNAGKHTETPSMQFLASAWLLRDPGLEGLGRAVAAWLDHHVDKKAPAECWHQGKQIAADESAPVLAGRLQA